MKLLFIHEVNWHRKPVFEIHDYPELLSLRGHKVCFIDFPEGESVSKLPKLHDFRTTFRINQSRAYLGSSIEVRTPGRICGAPIDRLVHSVTFIPLLIKTLWREKWDAIILYGVPTNGWQTIVLAKLFKIPVLFRAIDVSHDLRKTVFRSLIRVAEKFIYKSVQHISTNNVGLREHCIELGADESQVTVEYPGLDLRRFQASQRDLKLKSHLGIGANDHVILFMGTLYRFAGLSKFLVLVSPLIKAKSNVKFLILGDGEAASEIRETLRNLQLEQHVIMPGFVDYDELPKYLNLADVAVNTFESGLVTDCALPWKVVQYLACGIPTISTPLRGLMAYTGRTDGIIYRPLDVTFIDAVRELLVDNERRHLMSRVARELVVQRSSWDKCIADFELLLTDLAAAS